MESQGYKDFKGLEIEQQITVNKPVEELYRFWRNLENLPKFFQHIRRISILDERRSKWIAKGPLGMSVKWTSELTQDIPDRVLGWRSIDGDVQTAGYITFTPAPDGHGTVVKIILKYHPPAGRLGALMAKFLGQDPSRRIASDLQKFKQLMEAGASGARGLDQAA